MFAGFKKFLLRGNIIELSIAVVIGGAFNALVTAFTKNLVTPIISVFGYKQAQGFGFNLVAGNPATFVNLGAIISAIINFFLLALVVYFVFVVPMNKLEQRRQAKAAQNTEKPAQSPELETLLEIRDLLKAKESSR